MKNYKKIVSIALSSLMLASSITVLAEQGDIYNGDGSLYKTRKEVGTNKAEQRKVTLGKYLYESANGDLYNFKDANDAYKNAIDKSKFLEDLEKNYEPVVSGNTQELKVESVSAINATTIRVTLSNGTEDTITTEITLEEALVHGQTKVTFVYQEVEYTAELTEAYVDPSVDALEVATNSVVNAENTLLEADLTSAKELVNALEASDAKTLLSARLDSLQLKLNGIIATVNSANTEIKLYNALNVKPFVNVNVDNISAYDTALTSRDYTSIADIQAIINTVNANAVNGDVTTLVNDATAAVVDAEATPSTATLITEAQEAIDALPAEIPEAVATALNVNVTVKADLQARLDAVKVVVPVLEATNQIQLLAALQNSAFERVNEDLIKVYATNLDGTQVTVATIQGVIDAANLLAAQTAVATAEGSLLAADVSVAQVLVNNLQDLDPNTVKEGLQTKIAVVNALIALDGAKTEAEVLAALKAEVLELTDVNDAVAAQYKTIVDGLALAISTDLQNDVIVAGNAAALTAAIQAIETNFAGYTATDAADQGKALEELNRLAEVSDDVDSATINSSLIEGYITAISSVDFTDGTPADAVKAQLVQTAINGVNSGLEANARLEAVNEATNATEMRTALTALAVSENTTAYINLSSQAKLEVAELVLVARAEATDKKFAQATDVIAAIDTADTARTDFLAAVNAATTIDGMVTALNKVELSEFQALGSLDKVEKAEAVLNALKELKAQDPASELTTIKAIKTAAGL